MNALDKFERVWTKEELRDPVAAGKLNLHVFLLGGEGVGKGYEAKRLWPQTTLESLRYEEIVDEIIALRRSIHYHRQAIVRKENEKVRVEGWLKSAKQKAADGDERARDTVAVHQANLVNIGIEIDRRTAELKDSKEVIESLDAKLPTPGERWIWLQGAGSIRGLVLNQA